MKEIKAIIQPHMVSKVVRALHELPHFPGLTLLDALGQGRGRGAGGAFQVTEDNLDYQRKTVIEIVCTPELAGQIVEIIQRTAHTGHPGDGMILVTEIPEVIRIRTGEKQTHAV
jgi:nitrogen regulatory protein P-II 1